MFAQKFVLINGSYQMNDNGKISRERDGCNLSEIDYLTSETQKMTNDKNSQEEPYKKRRNRNAAGASGGVYGLAFIGALVYYIQHATTFVMGVIGFLKAVVWPAVLVYKVLEFLKM